MLAGIDGCRGGWVLILEHQNGTRQTRKVGNAGEIADIPNLELAVIDIPLGVLDSDPRLADREARRFLGQRGCCVFPSACRSVLAATTYEDACSRLQRIDGKRMSKQAFEIIPKIREVDAVLTLDLQTRSGRVIQKSHSLS